MTDNTTSAGIPDSSKVLFFTCATGFYESFVVLYAYFAALTNYGAKFEFLVDDRESFYLKHGKAVHWLEKNLDLCINIRGIPEIAPKPRMDNTIRFLIEPEVKAEYVYIGDIDIFILEDVFNWHRPIFDAGLPYSNIVRTNMKRLTGLHFCRFDAQYPLPKTDDLVASKVNDEEILYLIVERKGLLYQQALYNELVRGRPIRRPVHGLHMSLNRLPFSLDQERLSWGMTYDYAEKYNAFIDDPLFPGFSDTLYPGSRLILCNLMFLVRGICSYGKEAFTCLTRK